MPTGQTERRYDMAMSFRNNARELACNEFLNGESPFLHCVALLAVYYE